jgi:hypothetical protein
LWNQKLGEFTMLSQPIRSILVVWLYAKRKHSGFFEAVFHFF